MEFTRHWEESLGRFFTIPELEILGSESSVEFITRNRGNLAVASYQSILTMVENGWQSVPVFAVKGDPIVFYLEMEEIGKTIDQCIDTLPRSRSTNVVPSWPT